MPAQPNHKKKLFKVIVAGIIFISLIMLVKEYFPPRILRWIQNITNITAETVTCKNCSSYFPDGVATHETAYRQEGISPREKISEIYKLEKTGKLIRVKDGRKYYLAEMSHSAPLLLPKATAFLEFLAERYESECKKRGLKYHSFKITSMTRSLETVNDLQKVNEVAIKNSPHLKGKTMDISYTEFSGHQTQLDAFVTALSDLRKEKKCFVKYEKSTGCLHITAR